jgi:hypothetical protein
MKIYLSLFVRAQGSIVACPSYQGKLYNTPLPPPLHSWVTNDPHESKSWNHRAIIIWRGKIRQTRSLQSRP